MMESIYLIEIRNEGKMILFWKTPHENSGLSEFIRIYVSRSRHESITSGNFSIILLIVSMYKFLSMLLLEDFIFEANATNKIANFLYFDRRTFDRRIYSSFTKFFEFIFI